MPIITPQEKKMDAQTFLSGLRGQPPRLYRNIVFECFVLRKVPPETIRSTLQHIAEHVEVVNIKLAEWAIADTILSGLFRTATRASRLKKLSISPGWVKESRTANIGDLLLSALHMAPSLEELRLASVRFSEPEIVKDFFATSTSLKVLHLQHVQVVAKEKATAEAVASAFGDGLQRSQSLTRISLAADSEPLLRECLLGIMGNSHVLELSVNQWSDSMSNETLSAVRALVSGTTSLQKLHFDGHPPALTEAFVGLASNHSIQELHLVRNNISSFIHPTVDVRLASAIRECCQCNKTLQVCKLSGGKLGPRSRVALTNCLSQLESLKKLHVRGELLSLDVLKYAAKFTSVSLTSLGDSADWGSLPFGVRSVPESNLQVLNLSGNELNTQNLTSILSCVPLISELSLNHCDIRMDSVPLLCDFIRTSQLKKLGLGFNRLGSQGAARILDAVRGIITLEHLIMDGPGNPNMSFHSQTALLININECHESLQRLLVDCRLVSLNLKHSSSLGIDFIRSLAAGLRVNTTLKTIKVPWLELEFVGILGEALTENGCLESLEVGLKYDDKWNIVFEELGRAEEEAMVSFIGMMPQMKCLASIKGVFDFVSSERLADALVAALKQNTVLKQIEGGHVTTRLHSGHVCKDSTVQFYLELNRLGRQHYLTSPESKPVPVVVLPHLFARMSEPECSSHLYDFLRHTSPDLLA